MQGLNIFIYKKEGYPKMSEEKISTLNVTLFSFAFQDYTIQLANSLSKKNVNVLLIIPSYYLDELVNSIDKNIKVHIYDQPRLYDLRNIKLILSFLSLIKHFNTDIVHIQGGYFWLSFALPILKLFNYKVIVTFHDPKPHIGENYLRTRFGNFLGRLFSDRVFVHGEKMKEILITEYNFPEKKIQTIPIGEHNVEPFRKYAQKNLQEDCNYVLFFGRIWKYKGLDYLIKAEPLISKEVPGVKLVIAGRGENFQQYENLIVNKKNFIIYNHYISYKEGAELFQKSSLVVLPYIDASQSGVVVTAYGFKKPVVATNVGSIPEIVDNNITGIIVPPKDHVKLAEAIITLLRNEELRKRMGKSGYYKLKTDLSWDKISYTTINIYKKLMN